KVQWAGMADARLCAQEGARPGAAQPPCSPKRPGQQREQQPREGWCPGGPGRRELVKETFRAASWAWVSTGHRAWMNCGDSNAPPPTRKGLTIWPIKAILALVRPNSHLVAGQ
ncbi:hypothetical protein P7K49_021310, partial [Saguinus oedipus]